MSRKKVKSDIEGSYFVSAATLDGKALGLRIEEHLAERVSALKESRIEPHLAVVLLETTRQSCHVRNKQRV